MPAKFQPFALSLGNKGKGRVAMGGSRGLTTEDLQLIEAQERGPFRARPAPNMAARDTHNAGWWGSCLSWVNPNFCDGKLHRLS